MSDPVTDLFTWAASVPLEDGPAINIAVTSGLFATLDVVYATGQLIYQPARRPIRPETKPTPARFESGLNDISQYFSDRGFNEGVVDSLTMTLTDAPPTLVVTSAKYHFTVTIPLAWDSATNVMTGNAEAWFYFVMFKREQTAQPSP